MVVTHERALEILKAFEIAAPALARELADYIDEQEKSAGPAEAWRSELEIARNIVTEWSASEGKAPALSITIAKAIADARARPEPPLKMPSEHLLVLIDGYPPGLPFEVSSFHEPSNARKVGAYASCAEKAQAAAKYLEEQGLTFVQIRDCRVPVSPEPPRDARSVFVVTDEEREQALSLAHEIHWLATTPSGTARELKRRNGCVVQRVAKLIKLLEKPEVKK